MRLKILLPTKILIDKEVTKVIAEAENGYFCLLPRHIDFVTSLVPGILTFNSNEEEEFVAIDEGILVKINSEVMVSTMNAVYSKNLGQLKQDVEEQFWIIDDREKKALSVLAKLETDFTRRFLELKE